MLTLLLIAAFTLVTAAAALSLRNIIRSAIFLVPAWIGIAAFYLWAGAEFVAFAQVLVYVGAISMVVLFAVVLTRRAPDDPAEEPATRRRLNWAVAAGGAVAAMIFAAILCTALPSPDSAALASDAPPPPSLTIKDLGHALTGEHAAAVLITGALLTVALLGSILLAATDKPRDARTTR
ncbi:NADH-quinone oxidoreductase subunit J family protein [Geminisphaera colitermitum]|uniref:NADH-quinone oxidoreductase subunit J family protein n=1 Tax=Geminisphaera colitermitum TaxID=1148786 RepID=UPI000158D3FD|nr:NADH-quinone oxidoreductase subunit J [Geminisphaera colitermitum]